MIITYQVLVIQNTNKEFFHYTHEEILPVGKIVKVYFGTKLTYGCIWHTSSHIYEGHKKNIEEVMDITLPSQIISFIESFSDYHLCGKQEVLKKILQKMPSKYKPKETVLQNISCSIHLTKNQQLIYEGISKQYNTYNISLIFGITGSGKTEIYFKLIQDIINAKGQVLVLLPEIGIISGIKERLEKQLRITPVLWFAGVKTTGAWNKVISGHNVVVLAARSGIFLPFKNLKLIVVDEEHDMSYKQSNNLCYHARNMSILLGKVWRLPVVLGSATPSTETYYRVINNQYTMYRLCERFGAASLPKVEFIQEQGAIVNNYCMNKITETLKEGQQVLVYLNKRGFAGVLECISCHAKQRCTQCDQMLVLHNLRSYLMCHICSKKYSPNNCIKCASTGLIAHGYGVERLESLLKSKFPTYKIGVFSSDECNSSKSIQQFLDKVKSNFYQIIVGTQITAKGHNFPNLALVVIINTTLQSGDFRGKEVLLQNLLQVSGRAGRSEGKSSVLVQSNDMYLHQWLREEQYETFLKKSMEERQLWQLPPFYKLLMIKYQHRNILLLKKTMQAIFETIEEAIRSQKLSIVMFPPSNNPIAHIRGEYRMFILLKTKNESFSFLLNILNNYRKCQVDVNPYEFY